jgi:hypothetical protein
MKTAKKLFGLLLVVATLLLAACSQAPTPTEGLKAQGGGVSCSTAAPVTTLSTTITHTLGDWYSGNSLGSMASALTITNRASSSTLRVEIYTSCSLGSIPATTSVSPGSSMTIPLPSGVFYVRVFGPAGTPYDLTYNPPIVINPDACIYQPGLCTLIEVPWFIFDGCHVCYFDLSIYRDIFESYRIRLTIPELGLKPDQFTRAFAFKVLTSQGKLIAQGKGNGQEAMLELVTKLPKGSYKLQVNILDQSIAKIIHANKQKYPLKFGFSLVK